MRTLVEQDAGCVHLPRGHTVDLMCQAAHAAFKDAPAAIEGSIVVHRLPAARGNGLALAVRTTTLRVGRLARPRGGSHDAKLPR